nr:MAG: capsid protein [Cressdnaviricota sp.]
MYKRKFVNRRTYKKKSYGRKTSTYKRKTGRTYKIAKRAADREIRDKKQVKHTQYEAGPTALTDSTTSPASFIFWPSQGVEAYGNIEAEGSSQGQRIGNKIYIKSICATFQLTLGEGITDDAENLCRMTIFQWKDDNQLHYPTFGDIFTNSPTGLPYLAQFNYDSRHKYKILYDKNFTLSQNAGSPFTRCIKLKLTKGFQRTIVFDGDSQNGYNAGIYRGSIYWVFTSDSSIAPNPEVTWSLRMNYTD